MHDQTTIGGPYRYDQNQKTCAWPSRLKLELNDAGGRFTQPWQLYTESLIRLPGGDDHWPLDVVSQNGALLVQSKSGVPYVKLSAGEHVISDQFQWRVLPKSLTITPEAGLVDLRVNNIDVERPQFGDGG